MCESLTFNSVHSRQITCHKKKILVPGTTSHRSSRGLPAPQLHSCSPQPQAVQSVVRHFPASGVPYLIGPSLSSGCSPPMAHYEALAATGPCVLLRLSFQSFLEDHLPEYIPAFKFLFQAQPFTHPMWTTRNSKVHIREQKQQG